jgi:hypothetical protein
MQYRNRNGVEFHIVDGQAVVYPYSIDIYPSDVCLSEDDMSGGDDPEDWQNYPKHIVEQALWGDEMIHRPEEVCVGAEELIAGDYILHLGARGEDSWRGWYFDWCNWPKTAVRSSDGTYKLIDGTPVIVMRRV